MPGKALVIEAVAVEAVGRNASADSLAPSFAPRDGPLVPIKSNRVYTGGGFHDAGLHSVLEPAAFGAPVLFGPRHAMSRDAGLLIARGGAA